MNDTASTRAHWYELEPDRLQFEIEAFAQIDLPCVVTYDKDRDSQLVLRTEVSFENRRLGVDVRYPVNFPDNAPTLVGDELILDRHQNPTMRDFCILENVDADWNPGLTGAALAMRLRDNLIPASEAGPAEVTAGEADMPEPTTGYLQDVPGSAFIVVDPFWETEFSPVNGSADFTNRITRSGVLQMMLTHVANNGSADAALVDRFLGRESGRTEHKGGWVQIDDPSALLRGSASLTDAVLRNDQYLKDRLERRARKRSGRVAMPLAITFMEQGGIRGELRRGWVFTTISLTRGSEPVVDDSMLSGAQALTRAQRTVRIPDLRGLDDSSILVVGAGSLGSPLVLELAKAGVGHITLVDFGIFDVNNAVRHVLPAAAAGEYKANAVGVVANALNPFITVTPVTDLHVGRSTAEMKALDDLIALSDLVIDATGSTVVTRTLARATRAGNKSLMTLGLTLGSLGGDVAFFSPEEACFECMLLRRRDGVIPTPDAGEPSKETPVNCSSPTFSGAGFDASQLASFSARSAIQKLGVTGLPRLDWNVAVVNFRSDPALETLRFERHSKCPICAGSK